MKFFSAADANRKLGALIALTRKEPVGLTRYGRPIAVLISAAEFRDLMRLKQNAFVNDLSACISDIEAANDSAVDGLAPMRKLSTLLRSYRT